jgi:hypothetical protein
LPTALFLEQVKLFLARQSQILRFGNGSCRAKRRFLSGLLAANGCGHVTLRPTNLSTFRKIIILG